MQVIGEHFLFDPLSQRRRVVVGKGAYVVPDAGTDVPGAGGRIAFPSFLLVDAQKLDDRLELLIDLLHILQADPLDLKALAGGQMDVSVPVLLSDLLYHTQDPGIQVAPRHPDPGGSDPPDLGYAKGVLFQFLCIDVQSHPHTS